MSFEAQLVVRIARGCQGAGPPGHPSSTHSPWVCSVRFAEVEDGDKEEEEENPLLVPLEERTVLREEQASLWFSKVRRGWQPRKIGNEHSLGERRLEYSPSQSQDGFSGLEDDADEALEISQAQLLYESRRKGRQQLPPPSSLKPEEEPPPCQEKDPAGAGAASEAEATSGPGGEERDGSSDSDSSSEDGER